MTDNVLTFRPRAVNLDDQVELYTAEDVIAKERRVGNSDGQSDLRRELIEKLMAMEAR